MFETIPDPVSEFSAWVESRTQDELAAWLRRGLALGDFHPVIFYKEPMEEAQLQDFFEMLSRDLREKFKAATLLALSAWNPAGDGPVLLRRLVVVAAFIRETRVVDFIRVVIADNRLRFVSEADRMALLQTLIAVAGGFAPDERVLVLFERLFTSPAFARFGAQLFVGLCACNPESYPGYVAHMLHLLGAHPQFFREDYLIAETVHVLGLATIARRYQAIEPRHRSEFIERVAAREWSPARLRFTESGEVRIYARPDFEPLGSDFCLDQSEYVLLPAPEADRTDLEEQTTLVFAVVNAVSHFEDYLTNLRKSFESVAAAVASPLAEPTGPGQALA